jgi:hypothetical protein
VCDLLLHYPGQDGIAVEFPCVWRLLLRRMVATEAGILFGGRSYSSRDDRSPKDHWMITPVLRVVGCTKGSDGAPVGFLDRNRLGCASGGPNNATSSRLPAHALSLPLSTIDGRWACYAVNCVLSSGSRSSQFRRGDC